ncbi:MAG: glycosyltransferase [Chloracidobacterium sp.]|nr:glycosyltransferase [Chloracidobacterium sp.]
MITGTDYSPPLNYLQTGTPIREILSAEKPDIIEIGEKYLLSLLAGVIRTGHFKEVGRPVLIHFSHERMDDNLRAFVSKGKFFNWFSRQLVRNYILPMFDYHIANSNYTAGELTAGLTPSPSPLSYAEVFSNFCSRKLNAGALRSTGDVKVSNCGADFQFYNSYQRNDKVRRQLLIDAGFPEDARVILYAGRISPEKNISLIPTIFQLLQGSDLCSANQGKYRLLILGSGPLSDWLEDELNRLTPGQFKMMGHLADKTKLAEVYANSDAFFIQTLASLLGSARLRRWRLTCRSFCQTPAA